MRPRATRAIFGETQKFVMMKFGDCQNSAMNITKPDAIDIEATS